MYFTLSDIQARRERLARKWDAVLKDDEAVLVYAGSPIQKPGGLDQTYPFLQHPAYFWLTGRRREEEAVLYSKSTGWVVFQQPLSPDLVVWEGPRQDVLVEEPSEPLAQLPDFLARQQFATVYALGQSGQPVSGKALELRTLLDQTRRVKDAAEIRLIRHIADIAAAGYRAITQHLRPGLTEKQLWLAYEAAIFEQGADAVPYDTIVGSGRNAAILHALPTQKVIGERELVLVDAGAALHDYCVDITRTYASSPDLDSRSKALYQLVYAVQQECIAMTKAGTWWRDVHNLAATRFTEGLLQLGILKGSLQELLEQEVVAVFFPHGLGHLVGLRVRDTGHEENLEPKRYFGARLRVDIRLEQGHLITVEPGLYFIRSLLELPETQQKFGPYLNHAELQHWLDLGGVRIEDNILVTETGNENLTVGIPKAAEV